MATLRTPPPATQGYWTVEKRSDGSYGVFGPDPQDGKPVLVAPFETEEDARHVVHLHNCRVTEARKNKAYDNILADHG